MYCDSCDARVRLRLGAGVRYLSLSRDTVSECIFTLSNVDAGETAPTPVTTVLSLQNLMDANKFLVLFNVI